MKIESGFSLAIASQPLPVSCHEWYVMALNQMFSARDYLVKVSEKSDVGKSQI